MRKLGAASVLWFAAAAAAAQDNPIEVRSNLAPGVSEIRIALKGRPFALERVGPRQIDVIASESGQTFDTTRVATASKSPHIESIRQVPDEVSSRLRFVLKCDCEFDLGVQGGNVQLRILDPLGGEIAMADDLPKAQPASQRRRIRGSGSPNAPFQAPSPLLRRASGEEPEPSVVESASATEEPADAPAALEDAPATAEVRLAREHLMRQLARAADQGLLEFKGDSAEIFPEAADDPPRPSAQEEEPPETTEIETAEAAPAAAPEEEAEPQVEIAKPVENLVEMPLRARTAKDRDFRPDRGETFVRAAPCIDEGKLDLSAWIEDRPFIDAVAAYRAVLVDQFDEPRANAVTSLSRLYIAHGFGAEASQLLELYGEAVEDRDVLSDLAKIVDGRRPASDGPLAESAPCSGPATLWRRAAGLRETGPAGPETSDDEMITAFSDLPLSVRSLIGPSLIVNLVDRDEVDAAQRINLILSRVPESNMDALDFARAKLLASTGEVEAAEALLRRLAKRDSPQTREALIALSESLIERGGEIPKELTDSLSAAARLARGETSETMLVVAATRARLFSDGLAPALASADDAMKRTPSKAEAFRDAAHSVLEMATADRVGRVAYSRAIIAYGDLISPDKAGDAARRKVARELTDLGLANAALDILSPSMVREDPSTQRTAAFALLSLGRPEDALIAIEGLEDDESLELRVSAYEQLGRFEDAAKARALLGAADLADAALRAGDWAGAAQNDDEETRLLAAYMAALNADEDAPAGAETDSPDAQAYLNPPAVERDLTLENARRVMDGSRSVRETIEKALTDG